MTTAEKIYRFFETYNTQHFLQFPPGAGGEFIAKTVIEHSNRYKKTESFMDSESNRTTVIIPRLYKLLASAEVRLPTLTDLSNALASDCEMHGHDIDVIIKEAEEYNDYGSSLNLIRIHHSTCEIFNKSNTFSIYPDNERTMIYCNILRTIKAMGKQFDTPDIVPIYINEFKRGNINKFPVRERLYEDAIEWVITNRPNVIHGHIYCLPFIDKLANGKFESLFNLTIQEIIDFLKLQPQQGTTNMLRISYKFLDVLSERYNTIFMSKMFEPGYLTGKFGFENKDVDVILQNWHQTNLDLIKSYGIDLNTFTL